MHQIVLTDLSFYTEIIQLPFCSGVLLNPNMVLTSFRCFDRSVRPKERRESDDMAVVGPGHNLEQLLTTESVYRKVKQVHNYPNASNPQDDLAIAVLEEPFDLNLDISFACLINREIITPANGSTPYIASGFMFDKRLVDLVANKTYFKSYSKDEWQYYIREAGCKLLAMPVTETDRKPCVASERQICVSAGQNASTCIGDTGVNLLYQFENQTYVAGVSGGLKGEQMNCSFGKFASVYPARAWIEEITGGNFCPPRPVEITHDNSFNQIIKKIGIAYFVISVILLVLLTAFLKRKGLGRKTDKPKAAEVPNEPVPEDGQSGAKNVDTGGSVAQKVAEEPKKAEEGVKKVDESLKKDAKDVSEGGNKPDDEKSEKSERSEGSLKV